MDVDLLAKLAGLAGIAVAWGDLRRQVRGLADEVRRQNGRIAKNEDKTDEIAEMLGRLRGFLKL